MRCPKSRIESATDKKGWWGFRALADWVGDKESIVGDKFGVADVAAAALGVLPDMLM
jgi:hypothetical protein